MIELISDVSIVMKDSIDAINQIGKNTYDTAQNTKFGIIALITFVVSLSTLLFAVLTYFSQRATQRNTSRLGRTDIFLIMLITIDKLYYSFVDAVAIHIKMKANNYEVYPSELCMEGMKIDMEYFTPYILVGLKENELRYSAYCFSEIKKYNKSIDIYKEHFKSANINSDTKNVDLMLLQKNIVFLISEIGILQQTLCTPRSKKNYKMTLLRISNTALHMNVADGFKKELPYKITSFKDLFSEYWKNSDKILESIDLSFQENLKIQLGEDSNHIEKIQMLNIDRKKNN